MSWVRKQIQQVDKTVGKDDQQVDKTIKNIISEIMPPREV
jgi:hypothetical protein